MTHQSTRNPMSEARRNAVHGPLHPMEQERDLAWLGAVLCALSAVVSIYGFIALARWLSEIFA